MMKFFWFSWKVCYILFIIYFLGLQSKELIKAQFLEQVGRHQARKNYIAQHESADENEVNAGNFDSQIAELLDAVEQKDVIVWL